MAKKLLKVWVLDGHDDEGDFDIELFSTYKKARKAFDWYVGNINRSYGDYDEEEGEYESVCEIEDDRARYECGSHFGSFWIYELGVD